MSRSRRWRESLVSLILAVFVCRLNGNELIAFAGDDLRSDEVRASIARGVAFLQSQQAEDGSFVSRYASPVRFQSRMTKTANGRVVVSGVRVTQRSAMSSGPTALATLCLLNAGMSNQDPRVAPRHLVFFGDPDEPEGMSHATYEDSLLVMALAAAREWDKDRSRISFLAKKLEGVQTTQGRATGDVGLRSPRQRRR